MTIVQERRKDRNQPDQKTTVAQFVFDHDPALNLPLLVSELDSALQRSGAGMRMITWDCDDLVLLDVEGARFSLGYTSDTALGPASLMISVGPGPNLGPIVGSPPDPADRRRHEDLCHLIVARLKARLTPERMLWHQVTGPVTADLIDDLFDRLPTFEGTQRPATTQVCSPTTKVLRAFPENDDLRSVSFAEKAFAIKAAKTERARIAALAEAARADAIPAQASPLQSPQLQAPPLQAAPAIDPANSQPARNRPANEEMARLRAALYPEPAAGPDTIPAKGNVKLRLAATTMDMTLMMVFLPAGAAMLTYSVLRGGNVNASARMMALTCSVIGLSQLPFAHSLMGLI